MSQNYQDPFITVVSVGTDTKSQRIADGASEFVTVLTIGNEESKIIKDVTEEVIVYRLPGERLGFGLKFEGGTKAHEFVKRLFIQSCAPDSPASRVQSSWGQLVEGDEVLKIDSVPVNSMTRIDCVRLLKESNVAIKLLVKHSFNVKVPEDLPVIVSEEKKPPPVPPRKIHRKLHKNHENSAIVPTNKQQESLMCKGARLQSPRNSGRRKYSPDVCRRLSEGNPPDAEVYLDLFSQESTQSLSESDDTGSTISTVLDRFASTTSSFAGSLPSTPTSIQKQLDLSYIVNEFEEDDYNMPNLDKKIALIEENNNIVDGADHCRHSGCEMEEMCIEKSPDTTKKPIKTPRSRDKVNKHVAGEGKSTLPRLVDFVPKSSNKSDMESSVDTLKRFLECERFDFDYSMNECVEGDDLDFISNGMDLFGTKWVMSSHLSTIGEDEEEGGQDISSNFGGIASVPKVTVESSELNTMEEKSLESDNQRITSTEYKYNPDLMEVLPSDSRQPPDGHEFPDFIETSNNFKEKPTEPTGSFNFSWNDLTQIKPVPLDRTISSSNYDLRQDMSESEEEKFETPKTNLLHTRSQSLIDMSIFSKEKHSKWNTLAEQRKRRLSKLKGLVIPEASENEITPCDIPEIKNSGPTIVLSSKSDISVDNSSKPITRDVPLVLPSWSTTTVPKYSPAFKRKSLQVYPSPIRKISSESIYENYLNTKFLDNNGSRTTNDDPKSLESIASPTRSDCSFDYVSSRKIDKFKAQDSTKHDDESDNDSAVSSSQSSYNSRCSPPLSPTSDDRLNNQNRLLKPFSVEAVNRKNILASAKCSSGKDLKIGSPVIQRKYEEEEKEVKEEVEVVQQYQVEPAIPVVLKTANAIAVNGDEEQTATMTNTSEEVPEPAQRSITMSSPKGKTENIGEIRKSVLSKYSSSNNKRVNVKSLKENFENAAANSLPVFPKNFVTTEIRTRPVKANSKELETKPLVELPKPIPARRQTQNKEISGKKSEENPIKKAEKEIVTQKTLHLNRDSIETHLGIILAAGGDCQFKTVHRIRYGSVAYQDGTLKKGDKILSINGQSTADLSHDAATELLKEPCISFTIVYEELTEVVPSNLSRRSSSSMTSLSAALDVDAKIVTKRATHTVGLIKDGAGLGFSIEGGKDSPKGDVPLLVKKIFTGGAADKCGELHVGDEILAVNEVSCANMSRMEAWTLMKKIPEGAVKIQIYR
ncbi:uncharacterized protein LOC132695683 [Cylas formicarius]|uniref:uncharacterized protein LOC132695683 n=1 Tax=Cylas formicarius TaxID=197179 RepID=UPI0029584DEC|nr:uncharacterized protein LOC132695683 [Cylas formicarius]XP_060516078.1 uncharacterized protein LOC132695683 [Cylas formicarius]